MVASSVASKGLDFSEIQHVINYSMPKEIEVSLLFLHVSFPFCARRLRARAGWNTCHRVLFSRSWRFPRTPREHVLTWVGLT
jgi:hypothetical protein